MNKISAIIAVKDHPQHIFETIKSIEDIVSEIIILDIGIQNALKPKLKKNPKVKIVLIEREIPYVELIREKSKKYAQEDYILFLDPDEVFPEHMKDFVNKNLEKYDFFSFPRKNIIFDKWIQHSSWWPDYQTRLFKKDKVQWPQEIHHQPNVSGNGYNVETIEELAITHFNYETIDDYLQKALRYAKAEAHDLEKADNNFSLPHTLRLALHEFINRFFAEKGYKDGMHGFVLAFLQMFYYFLVYFYIWEKDKKTVDEKVLIEESRNFFRNGLYETNHWITNLRLGKKISKLSLKIQNYILKK